MTYINDSEEVALNHYLSIPSYLDKTLLSHLTTHRYHLTISTTFIYYSLKDSSKSNFSPKKKKNSSPFLFTLLSIHSLTT